MLNYGMQDMYAGTFWTWEMSVYAIVSQKTVNLHDLQYKSRFPNCGTLAI